MLDEAKVALGQTCIAERYRLDEHLGRGGMAHVYGAFDKIAQRRVALKCLKAEKRSPAVIELFQREFYTLKQLAHPRIVEAYDYGVHDGQAYYTMELLDGTDLRSLAPLDFRRACALLRDVASCLCVLHSRRLVHRDLSARNVRCTADGCAKLIDFGAMVPYGRGHAPVGTAPFVAPEVLERQDLDGRADLYALGALAYWLITGRHAYPVDGFSELRDAWTAAPLPLSMLVPEVPNALSELVMLLLCLDRTARPFNTADVIGKLGGVANLPPDDGIELQRAFLATPALIGRDREQSRVAERLQLGGAKDDRPHWLVRGAPGVGRTRLLDELRIEAKLRGASAVALSADHLPAAYGIAGELVQQLLEAHPDLRGSTTDDLQCLEQGAAGRLDAMGRERVHAEFCAWTAELARRRPLVITIDDLHAVDEPSMALVAALAGACLPGVTIAASLPETGAPSTGRALPALNLFSQYATELALEPLSRASTSALLASVFGDAPNLTLLAARLYEATDGYPRRVMELAEELVDTQVIVYSAGHWQLPERLEDVTGHSARAIMLGRLAALSSEARALAQAMSLSADTVFGEAECRVLIGNDAAETVFGVVDELTRARVLSRQDTHVRLAHAEWGPLVLEHHATDRALLHRRLATVFESRGQPARAAMHWTAAGEAERSAVCLVQHAQTRFAHADKGDQFAHPDEDPELYRPALEAALASQNRRPRERMLLQMLLVGQGWRSAPALWKQELPRLFERLAQDCGLRDYHSLSGPDRLARALSTAQARFEDTPASERVLAPADALRLLAQASLATADTASAWWDHELLELLPSLEPMLPLSPGVRIAHQVIEAYRHVATGHEANVSFGALLKRLDGADGASLAPEVRARSRALANLALGIMEGSRGFAKALERAAELDKHPLTKVLACRIRMSYSMSQGDSTEASRWQRQVERLQILHAPAQLKEHVHLLGYLGVYAFADDLPGVKRVASEVRGLAHHFPGWEPVRLFAEAACAHIQGDYASALRDCRAALTLAPAGRHPIWSLGIEQELWALVELGRFSEAVDVGHHRLAESDALGLPRWLIKPIAVAHARLGDYTQARALADEEVRAWKSSGSTGLHMGRAYEARARIAIYEHDTASFEKNARLCEKEYKRGGSHALTAKYQRLLDEARAQELTISRPLIRATQLKIALARGGDVTEGVVTSLRRAAPDDLAKCALALMLERAASDGGHLFLSERGGLCLAASVGTEPPTPAVWQAAIGAAASAAPEASTPNSEEATCSSAFGDGDSAPVAFRVHELWFGEGQARVSVGVVALRYTTQPSPPDQRFFAGVALALHERRETHMEDPQSASTSGGATVVARRYRLLGLLGRGGLGTVHRVHDEVTGGLLALKRLRVPGGEADAETRTLFEREYHTLKHLAHPSLIEVYDYGLDERGAPYYTMELLSGQDLRDLAPLPWREACRLVLPVASSLAVLHSRRLLHRDVSARNVRRTADGKAKLLDFGAMAPMGVAEGTMGTPPYLAPEAVHGQRLDARTDLYSLGALLYFVLTGRHAYPARRVRELRDHWRSPVASPVQRNTDIPEALSRLVMALMSLNENARPRTAAEVMARLSAIAGLTLQEDAAVHRAYLTTPKLVAREAELLRVRKLLVRSRRGRGGSLVVEAKAGLGRTRMLDACVLEAKLAGANAARVGASNTEGAAYLAMRTLVGLLHEGVPHLPPPPELDQPGDQPRADLLRAVRSWLGAACNERPCVLVVDDYHRIDEPSAAMLAALADTAEGSPMVVVVSALVGGMHAAPMAWEVFARCAGSMPLQPLSAAESEALLSSVFDDVPHVRLLAARLHTLTGGNPRDLLEAAQQLVDRGVVKYEGGRWALPDRTGEIVLERDRFDLAARLVDVSAPARRLAEVMALAADLAFSHDECRQLCEEEATELFSLLDELETARVVVRQGARYRLAIGEAEVPLAQGNGRQQAHRRLAEVLRARGTLSRAAVHYTRAGQPKLAVAALLELARDGVSGARSEPLSGEELRFRASKAYQEALAAATEAAQSARDSFLLRMLIVELGVHAGPALTKEHVPALLRRLTLDCGLDDYHALKGPDRLRRALSAAQARFDAMPETQRVASPRDSLAFLARVTLSTAQSATRWRDLDIFELLPSLEPLTPLSPSIAVAHELSTAIGHVLRAALTAAKEAYTRSLARLSQPDRAGLDVQTHAVAMLGASAGLGLVLASTGEAEALALATRLEQSPHGQVLACHVRLVYYLTLGDGALVAQWQRRAELTEIQRAPTELTTRRHTNSQLIASAYGDDLVAVGETVRSIEALAEFAPGWQPILHFARASYEHIRGNHETALVEYERALSSALPGRHMNWPMIQERQLWLLVEMGRLDDAIEIGNRALQASRRERLEAWLVKPLAVAHARLGQHARARELALEEVETWEHRNARGLHVGRAYETAARIAIYAKDQEAFQRYAALCARELLGGDRSALAAKYRQLLDKARQHGLEVPVERGAHILPGSAGAAQQRVRARLADCPDAGDRTGQCLRLLQEQTVVERGILFGVSETGTRVLAATCEAPAAMTSFVDAYLDAEIEESQTLTASLQHPQQGDVFTHAGCHYRPLVLRIDEPEGERIVGVVMLPAERKPAERQVVEAIAQALLDAGDVTFFRAAV